MIEAIGLTRMYGNFAAVQNATFRIGSGEIVCFLGPNGAGKSTTMKLLTGCVAPTNGSAIIAGYDMSSQRMAGSRHLGYLPENGPLYPDMTPKGFLEFFARLRGLASKSIASAIERVVDTCELDSVMQKPIGQLSRGYRQRVGMAQALLHEPDVLILDEPTAGLDPNQIRQVREAIKRIGRKKTILLSTHILQEVGAVASRVLFINKGQIVFDGTTDDFGKTTDDFDLRFKQLTEG